MTSGPVTETEYSYSVDENDTTSLTTVPPSCKHAMCNFFVVASVIIFTLGIAENSLIIGTIWFKVKKSVKDTWYLGLAMSDFLFCLFLPFDVIDMVQGDWVFGIFMCKLSSFIMSFDMFSSIFLLAIISVDFCVVVIFPVWAQNQRTVRRAFVIVMLVLIISAALSTPSAFIPDVQHDSYNQTMCFYNYMNDQEHAAEVGYSFIFGFVIPFSIITVSYVIVIQKLRKSNKKAKFKKPLKIMTELMATFFVCWLPYHIFALMELNYEEYEGLLQNGKIFVVVLACASSFLNPFLYSFMKKVFKNMFHPKSESVVQDEEQSTV